MASSGCCSLLSRARLPSLIFLGIVYVAYVLIGGAVFWKLEGTPVNETMVKLRLMRDQLFTTYPCLNQEGLQKVSELINAASKSGLSLSLNRSSDNFWKFTSSSVFAATVVTTIGYGNMSPSTQVGQIFCVFFALFGIPLNMVVLNKVGKYMLAIERNVCDIIEKKTKGKLKHVRVAIHTMSILVSGFLYFVAPMLLFQQYEGWSYAQAIYYNFITLSTIGFGDFVADDNPDREYPSWYSYLLGAWIFFGMAWLALLINHSIDLLEYINTCLKQGKPDDDDDTNQDKVEDGKEPAEKEAEGKDETQKA